MQSRLRPKLHLVEWLVLSDLTSSLCHRSLLNVRRSSLCPLFRVIALSARRVTEDRRVSCDKLDAKVATKLAPNG